MGAQKFRGPEKHGRWGTDHLVRSSVFFEVERELGLSLPLRPKSCRHRHDIALGMDLEGRAADRPILDTLEPIDHVELRESVPGAPSRSWPFFRFASCDEFTSQAAHGSRANVAYLDTARIWSLPKCANDALNRNRRCCLGEARGWRLCLVRPPVVFQVPPHI